MFEKLRGFTLIELLLVVSIIGILASLVIVAINPARQIAQANNAERWSNVNTILNAVHQYALDNNGLLPAGLAATPIEICQTKGSPICGGYVNLSALVPRYIVAMPDDPIGATTNGTGYTIASSTEQRITVAAPSAELGVVIEIAR